MATRVVDVRISGRKSLLADVANERLLLGDGPLVGVDLDVRLVRLLVPEGGAAFRARERSRIRVHRAVHMQMVFGEETLAALRALELTIGVAGLLVVAQGERIRERFGAQVAIEGLFGGAALTQLVHG